MKVVFCSSEVVPFAKTGGMADVCGALPIALERLGAEVVVFLPLYKGVDRKAHNIKPWKDNIYTTTIGLGIQVFLIEQKKFFDRDGLYGDSGGDYPDNLERFQYFCSEVLESLKRLKIKPDVIHCHDWQTALIPAYLKSNYVADPFFQGVKSVITIHNMAYQGSFPGQEFPKTGLDRKFFSPEGFEFYGKVNLLKGGIVYADRVTTVSPTYAKEIQEERLGCGLNGVLHQRPDQVAGILNGLDYEIWNPQTDPFIEKPYSAGEIKDRQPNKSRLQKDFNLPVKDNVPVLGFVGRLSYQKGLDLLAAAMDDIAKLDVQLVFLGVGEAKYHDLVKGWVKRYPQKIAARLDFDERPAHCIYAGCDIFLMPSVYEPCGLSQMISLRYGAIPLVFKTGGLADTISRFDGTSGHGNGFVFDQYDAKSLVAAVRDAAAVFQNKSAFSKLIAKAFRHDFSWEKSAKEYQKLYSQCLS